MEINIWAVLVCTILTLVIGFIWYGPIFGKKWMEITGADKMDMERRKEMMKGVWKLYIAQIALALLQVYVLAWYLNTIGNISSGIHTAFSIWLAFVMPTIAGTAMWNNDSAKISWARFFIQSGYQLIIFIVFGLILSFWK